MTDNTDADYNVNLNIHLTLKAKAKLYHELFKLLDSDKEFKCHSFVITKQELTKPNDTRSVIEATRNIRI